MADETQETTPQAATLQNSPWRADIEQSFTDPQVRAQVDSFLRGHVQPRVTQLEQQLASASDATELWNAFQSDPAGTYDAIKAQLMEAGVIEAEAAQQAADAIQAAEPTAPAAPAEDPRLQELLAWKQQQEQQTLEEQQMQEYYAAVDQVLADPANADINRDRFHKFVNFADGNFEKAIEMYREDVAASRQEAVNSLGLTPEQLAELTRNAPPPTLGQDAAAAGANIPVQDNYKAQGIDPRDALNQMIDRAADRTFRQPAPPVV